MDIVCFMRDLKDDIIKTYKLDILIIKFNKGFLF